MTLSRSAKDKEKAKEKEKENAAGSKILSTQRVMRTRMKAPWLRLHTPVVQLQLRLQPKLQGGEGQDGEAPRGAVFNTYSSVSSMQ
eukprot:COSAG02_NODE_869_length_16359_cov_49.339176_2_plen_86_part_00